jgi:hypothetical protein
VEPKILKIHQNDRPNDFGKDGPDCARRRPQRSLWRRFVGLSLGVGLLAGVSIIFSGRHLGCWRADQSLPTSTLLAGLVRVCFENPKRPIQSYDEDLFSLYPHLNAKKGLDASSVPTKTFSQDKIETNLRGLERHFRYSRMVLNVASRDAAFQGPTPKILHLVTVQPRLSDQTQGVLKTCLQRLPPGTPVTLWHGPAWAPSLAQQQALQAQGVQIRPLCDSVLGPASDFFTQLVEQGFGDLAAQWARMAVVYTQGGVAVDVQSAFRPHILQACTGFSLSCGLSDDLDPRWIAGRPGCPVLQDVLTLSHQQRLAFLARVPSKIRTQLSSPAKERDLFVGQSLKAYLFAHFERAGKDANEGAREGANEGVDTDAGKEAGKGSDTGSGALQAKPVFATKDQGCLVRCPVLLVKPRGQYAVMDERLSAVAKGPVKFPRYPLGPSVFSGEGSLFTTPIIYDDNDPAWQFDPRLLDRYAGKDSGPAARTQQASQAQQASTAKKPSAAGKSGGIEKASDLQKTSAVPAGADQAQWLASPSGLNPTPRKVPLIVCLTSWPPRIQNLWLVIESLMRQTCKPDRIILCLALDEFPGGHVPLTLRLLQNRGLEIRFVPNWRSGKKLLPLRAEHDSSILVTCDDDCWYRRHWLKALYDSHLSNLKTIWVGHQLRPVADKNGRMLPYYRAVQTQQKSSWRVYGQVVWDVLFHRLRLLPAMPLGATGVLYPPRSLHPDVWDANAFLRLCARNDDLWFYAMALRQGTPTKSIHPFLPWISMGQDQILIEPDQAQKHALHLGNCSDTQQVAVVDRDLHTVFSLYHLYQRQGLKPMKIFQSDPVHDRALADQRCP